MGTAAALFAQCAAGPPQATLSTRQDFVGSFYYGSTTAGASLVQYSDWTVNAPITINSMKAWNYDQGIGNPPVPNQVGATAVVKLYTCAGTWTGNNLSNPSTTPPGAPWTLVGTGSMTVVTNPAEATINFLPQPTIAAGSYGVALEWLATTSGPAPGPLHTLGVSPNNILTASDQFISLTNQGIQQTGWTSGVNANTGLNLRIIYTGAANAAYYTSFGDGCYFHPQAFYENFNTAAAPDLANTGLQMILTSPVQYLVVSTPSSIQPHTTPSITLGPTTGGSSGANNWDDAYLVETLPFAFPYPTPSGGTTTNLISVGSNGYIYLDAETSNSFNVCGASYGSLAVFQNDKARIAPFFADMDPTVGGGIFYEVDPSNTFVRITWENLQEFARPLNVNTFQMTLHNSGQVDISYGTLANNAVTDGDNAISGFTPGNGARLPAAMDIDTSLPFQTGDGSIPPVLAMDARPILNTTPHLVTSNLSPTTFFTFLVMGFSSIPGGIPLAAVGMPGCFQYINPATTLLAGVAGGQSSTPLFVPPNPAFLGLVVSAQNAPLTPGLNAAGILTSNGICMKVGGI